MKITVLGAGSFGTAMAKHLTDTSDSNEIMLWTNVPEQVQVINETHTNPDYYDDLVLDARITATDDIVAALGFSETIISAIPTQAVRSVMEQLAAARPRGKGLNILNLAKGIEIKSGCFLHQIAAELIPEALYSALSGPSHAEEVAKGMPAAVVIASRKNDVALEWQKLVGRGNLRVYTSDDVSGVELGGALKNVIAIAVGIARSSGFGDNTVAAIVTRGLAEMMRYARTIGVNPLTLAGLTGIGDLMVTCYSTLSRNLRFGLAIGRGQTPEEASREIGQVVEGMFTVRALVEKARKDGVELPVAEGVYRILYEGARIADVGSDLLYREPKPEISPN